jgi:cell wall-associated NlpC family hydrolase
MVPFRSFAVLAFAGLLGGCASTGAVPSPFPRPGASAATPASPPIVGAVGTSGYVVTGTALALRGSRYRDGGTDPSGFDCSGFVWYVFGQHGIALPRTVSDQYQAGMAVSADRLEPGDLVFFSTIAPGASHVGIAIGGDEFVHAPSGHGEVRVERLSSSYWASRFIGARRVI